MGSAFPGHESQPPAAAAQAGQRGEVPGRPAHCGGDPAQHTGNILGFVPLAGAKPPHGPSQISGLKSACTGLQTVYFFGPVTNLLSILSLSIKILSLTYTKGWKSLNDFKIWHYY